MVTIGNDSDLPLPCHIDSTSLVKLNFGEVGTGTGDSRPWHDVVEVYGGPGAELCCRDGKLLRALLQIRNVLLASYWIVVSDEIWTAVWGICGGCGLNDSSECILHRRPSAFCHAQMLGS